MASLADLEDLLDSHPNLAELMRQVCLKSEWYLIGVQLGLNTDELKAIRYSSVTEGVKTSDMYQFWLDSQPQATRRQLIEVLESMNLNRQAHDYKKYLKGIAAPIEQVKDHESDDRKQVSQLSDPNKTHKKFQNSTLSQVDSSISPVLSVQKDDLLHLPKLDKKSSPDSVHVKACMTRCEIELDEQLLDPEFDRDFTHISDDGRVYYRGGYPYKRPCGWMRIALKVKGKYENDTWLGTPDDRTQSSHGEWPVSYQGTSKEGAMGIAYNGYDEPKGKRFLFGAGHYSTPDIELAASYMYARPFQVEGKRYLAVIQNRVNLINSTIIPKEKVGTSDYYITPSGGDIHPYGICIKEI